MLVTSPKSPGALPSYKRGLAWPQKFDEGGAKTKSAGWTGCGFEGLKTANLTCRYLRSSTAGSEKISISSMALVPGKATKIDEVFGCRKEVDTPAGKKNKKWYTNQASNKRSLKRSLRWSSLCDYIIQPTLWELTTKEEVIRTLYHPAHKAFCCCPILIISILWLVMITIHRWSMISHFTHDMVTFGRLAS